MIQKVDTLLLQERIRLKHVRRGNLEPEKEKLNSELKRRLAVELLFLLLLSIYLTLVKCTNKIYVI